jgi:hypothetical protein
MIDADRREYAQQKVNIAAGQSLSTDVCVVGGHAIVSIQMPAAFTGTQVTFQGTLDGVNFANVYDDAGTEVAVPVVAGRVIVNGTILEKLAGLYSFKVRSGTSAAATTEGTARVVTFLTKA